MTRKTRAPGEKPLFWVGSAKDDLLAFPGPVKDEISHALGVAQFAGKHPKAKPWKGGGPGLFEIVEDYRTDTFRAVYTVRFESALYVLHAFQKKSRRGIKTALTDVRLISQRLRSAKEHYETQYGPEKK